MKSLRRLGPFASLAIAIPIVLVIALGIGVITAPPQEGTVGQYLNAAQEAALKPLVDEIDAEMKAYADEENRKTEISRAIAVDKSAQQIYVFCKNQPVEIIQVLDPGPNESYNRYLVKNDKGDVLEVGSNAEYSGVAAVGERWTLFPTIVIPYLKEKVE